MGTRKYLAPIDLRKPERQISGFLVPNPTGRFIEIASGKEFQAEIIVYVGKAIDAETVYERALRFGRNVEREYLERLIRLITDFKIGDVVAISTEPDFHLVKLKIEGSHSSRLPS